MAVDKKEHDGERVLTGARPDGGQYSMTNAQRLEFNESIMTGDEIIDTQHKYLIELINEIADVVNAGTGETHLGEILPTLQYFTEWHFGREEECMHARNCPFADTNKKAHGVFLAIIDEFVEQFRAEGGSNELALTIHTKLIDWFVNHIKTIDARIRDYPAPAEV